MNLRRLWAIMIKELRQLRRDRVTLAMIMGMPILQLLLFGYAINLNLRDLPAAVVDQAQTTGSRAAVQDLLASGVIQVHATAQSPQQLVDLLREGRISVGIAVPPDFERRKLDGREAIQVMVDGSDNVVQSAAAQLAQYPLNQPDDFHARAGTPISVVSFYNPERRSPVNIVPGLVGVILTMTMVLFTAVAIVREAERGNLELLITTPVSRTELMIGKVLPYAAIGLVQTTRGAFARRVAVPRADTRQLMGCLHGGQPADPGQSIDGPADFHAGEIAVPGHADDVLRVPAVHPAVGLHVSIRRHAAAGAMDFRTTAADPFHAPDSRHHAARCPAG